MKIYHLPPPTIEADKNFFKITFIRPDLQKRTIEERTKKEQEKWSEKWSGLSETQRNILALISENPKISRRDLSIGVNINPSAIQKHITTLKKKGILKRLGPDKGGHWEVRE